MLIGVVGQGAADRRDDRHDAATLLVRVDRRVAGPGRLAADVEQVGALVDHRRACATATATATGVAGGEQAVAGERVRRDVEDAHHERPLAPAERRAADRERRGEHGRVGGVGRSWSRRVRRRRDVPRPVRPGRAGAGRRRGARGPRRRDRASRPRRPARRPCRSPGRGPTSARSGSAVTSASAVRQSGGSRPQHARPACRELGRGQSARGHVDGRRDDAGAPRSRRTAPTSASMTPSTSLSAIDAVTSVTRTGGEERPQVVERAASAAAPAGLWAPSSRTSRPSTVSSSRRPGQRAVA